MRFCLALLILLSTTVVQAEDPLGEARWKERLLVVSTPNQSDPDYLEQKAILSTDPAGLQERDLHILTLFGPDEPELRQVLALDSRAFAVVLVGKDGGVKLRSPRPLTLAALYRLIDAMPMRQQEMRQK